MTTRAQRIVLAQTTPPAASALAVADVKAHCRIDDSTEDALITGYIKSAERYLEKQTSRQLMPATFKLSLDCFPRGIYDDPATSAIEGHDIICPVAPLSSIVSIKYLDLLGVETTLSSAVYVALSAETPGRIVLAYNNEWPTALTRAGAVTVEFIAGYASAAAVPEDIKQALLMLVGHWFENREAVIVGTISSQIAFAVESLI